MNTKPITMKPTPISLPPDLKDKAVQLASSRTESLAAYIRRLIVEDLKRAASTNS